MIDAALFPWVRETIFLGFIAQQIEKGAFQNGQGMFERLLLAASRLHEIAIRTAAKPHEAMRA